MKCPHCTVVIHVTMTSLGESVQDAIGLWRVEHATCPACSRVFFTLKHHQRTSGINGRAASWKMVSDSFIHPHGSTRPAPPTQVTDPYRSDYIEASAVLANSAKASAAISRRCLQAILKEKAGFTQKDLADQIDAALETNLLPSHITSSLDAVRNIGNFAAHTQKSKASGEVLDVEPGEADWNLDTLDALFDYYFVQPALIAKKREALNEKLKAAGKPPLKS